MKTPLQVLLNHMNDNKELSCFVQLRAIKNAVDDLLEEEKRHIEDAFLHGKRDGLFGVHQKPEDYFNSRYKQ